MKSSRLLGAALMLAVCTSMKTRGRGDDKSERPEVRTFTFTYGATLKGLPAGKKVRVWIPVPQSGPHQKVEEVSRDCPAEAEDAEEPKYGNRMLSFATTPESGKLSFEIAWKIARREIRGLKNPAQADRTISEMQRRLYIAANSKVPVGGQTLAVIANVDLPEEPLRLGQALYERVEEHMRYDKSRPGYGFGDAVWACQSQAGNCTDFHSLFISLARAKGLPARFEIGFPLPPERGEGEIGGYHCWGWFFAEGHAWVPVDVSEADKNPHMKDYYYGNLTADRVAFTTGRDIDLAPKQQGPSLNFFVYPYAEVGGKPVSKDQMELRFEYQDVGVKTKSG